MGRWYGWRCLSMLMTPFILSHRPGSQRALLQEILSVLKKSTIVPPEVTDKKTRLWDRYMAEADEQDRELWERLSGSMDSAMVFVRAISPKFCKVMH